jgi:hypothetical protein
MNLNILAPKTEALGIGSETQNGHFSENLLNVFYSIPKIYVGYTSNKTAYMVTSGEQQYAHQGPKSKMSIFLNLALPVTQASFVWHSTTNNGLPNN